MPHQTPLLALLAGALVLTFLLGTLAHRVKLSPMVGYLLAGILVGPFSPGFTADAAMAAQLAEIGVILLMFGVGLHFSIDDLREVRGTVFPYAVFPVMIATALGWSLAWMLGWSAWEGLVFGLALSVSSTVVLLRALEQHRLLDTTRGKTAIGWMIVEDLVVVLALVLLPVLARAVGAGAEAVSTREVLEMLGITFAKLLLFAALMLVVGRRIVPWLLRRVAGTGSRELFTLSVLAIALGVAFASAQWFGVSIALGAFFAGMLLNETELSHKAAADSLPMRDAFAVLFFVSVGMIFDPGIILREPLLVLATFLIIALGKPVAAFVVMRALGRTRTAAFTIAAGVSQIGEFSFILAGLAVTLNLLPVGGRDLVLAGALLSIVSNPLAFLWLSRWQSAQSSKVVAPEEPTPGPLMPVSGHTILVGYGRVGSHLALLLRDRGRPLAIVDNDADLIAQARSDGLAAVQGNAAAPDTLAAMSPEGATHALIAIPQALEAGEIIARLRKANPAMTILARAHSEHEVRHLLDQGADGAVLAERELAYSMAEMVMAAPMPASS